jgi:hypothetical protein
MCAGSGRCTSQRKEEANSGKKEIGSPEARPSPDSCDDGKADIVGYYGRPAVGRRDRLVGGCDG